MPKEAAAAVAFEVLKKLAKGIAEKLQRNGVKPTSARLQFAVRPVRPTAWVAEPGRQDQNLAEVVHV